MSTTTIAPPGVTDDLQWLAGIDLAEVATTDLVPVPRAQPPARASDSRPSRFTTLESRADPEPARDSALHELRARCLRRLEPGRGAGIPLTIDALTARPVDGVPEIAIESDGRRWALAQSVQSDPTAILCGGRLPVPGTELSRLRSLSASGLQIDRYVIGHEVPPGWGPGDDPRQLMVAPPVHRRMARRVVATGQAATWAPVAPLALAAIVAAAPLAAVGSMAAGLDPVILGGLDDYLPDGTPVTTWTLLAQWVWTA
jgi:hypothetical protein